MSHPMAQWQLLRMANGAPRAVQRPSAAPGTARGYPRQRNNGIRDPSDVKCQKMTMLFKITEFNMLANKAVVEERVWVRPRNTGLMGSHQCLSQGCPNGQRCKCARPLESQQPNGGGEPGPIYGSGDEQRGDDPRPIFEGGAAPERDCEDVGAGS
ncbi:hypothetical protein B9Z55_021519 [Caenorhabditis nigoni]|uniref:Uncharacterized protein n=1 Tax=Caenorhabditis nigoni TaxID=1611254 RepID=A0A2G5TSA2_9PELO|nr:hypothetical protein B9Z55_021519 [Caenorhabditis nigoni]